MFTAGSAWIVDLAPPERRGRVIGLYGLAVWAGLSIGPLIGELILHASGYTVVWLFAGAGAAARGADRDPPPRPVPAARPPRGGAPRADRARGGPARRRPRPGLDRLRDGRRLRRPPPRIARGRPRRRRLRRLRDDGRPHPPGRRRPARPGRRRPGWRSSPPCVEAIGLATIAIAQSLPVALAGALAMGAAFSLLYPSLSLIVVSRVSETRPRRRPGHLHRLLRRRRRLRRPAGRRRRGAEPATRAPSSSPP